MNKVALNIGSGIYQVPLIKKLKKLGFVVLSTDIDPSAPGLKHSDIKLITNSHDYKNLYKLIYKKKIKPIMIISSAASCLLTSAYLSKKFKLNYLNFKTANLISDKNLLSKKYNNHIYIGKYDRKNLIQKKIYKPLVLKIENYSGGDGIFKISNKNDLEKILKNFPNTKDFILEKYIQSSHYTIVGQRKKFKTKIFAILKRKINKDFTTREIKTIKLQKNFMIKFLIILIRCLKTLILTLGIFQ